MKHLFFTSQRQNYVASCRGELCTVQTVPIRDEVLLDQQRDVVLVTGLAVFGLSEADVTEVDTQPLPQTAVEVYSTLILSP
jgi:hypothetical protein